MPTFAAIYSIKDMKNVTLLRVVLSALLAVAVCCFFGLCYPHHLHFQEQYQLFLFNAGYAAEVMSVPGGVADYIGRFLTQFYLYAWLGATLLGVLLTAQHLLTAHSAGWTWRYALTFLPTFLLWRWLLDENVLTGAVVAVMLCQLAAWGISAVKSTSLRAALAVVALPLTYWAAGPLALWLGLPLTSLGMLRRNRGALTWSTIAVLIIMALAIPTVARHYVMTTPEGLVSGVHYCRTPEADTFWLWAAVVAMIAVEAAAWAENALAKTQRFTLWLTLLVGGAVGAPLIAMGCDTGKEKVMAYDFMARSQQWNRIISTAQAEAPNNAIGATVNNLAMAMRGRMAEHLFDYPQHGTEGLLPLFVRDPFSPLATSEVYYQLGMINTAQRFVFEAQEAIPDYQKSGRCYKRLAETNLINGQYAVARKYLLALQQTWYYRPWATETLALLDDEKAIASHPEYGRLRQMRTQDDYYYSDRELPQMLGRLFMSNKQNRLAFEYLEAACLLNCNLNMFVNSFGLNTDIDYPFIPTIFQQALILWWSRDHAANEPLPNGISPAISQSMKQFYADIQQYAKSNPDLLQQRYGHTFWYYYFIQASQKRNN